MAYQGVAPPRRFFHGTWEEICNPPLFQWTALASLHQFLTEEKIPLPPFAPKWMSLDYFQLRGPTPPDLTKQDCQGLIFATTWS